MNKRLTMKPQTKVRERQNNTKRSQCGLTERGSMIRGDAQLPRAVMDPEKTLRTPGLPQSSPNT